MNFNVSSFSQRKSDLTRSRFGHFLQGSLHQRAQSIIVIWIIEKMALQVMFFEVFFCLPTLPFLLALTSLVIQTHLKHQKSDTFFRDGRKLTKMLTAFQNGSCFPAPRELVRISVCLCLEASVNLLGKLSFQNASFENGVFCKVFHFSKLTHL